MNGIKLGKSSIASVGLLAWALLMLPGCGGRSDGEQSDASTRGDSTRGDSAAKADSDVQLANVSLSAADKLAFVEKVRPEVTAFCGDCHAMPRPASSPIAEWPAEVSQGYTLYRTSGRSDLVVPDRDDVLKFFQYQAPERLEHPPETLGYPDPPIPLVRTPIAGSPKWAPGVTAVRWLDLGLEPDTNSGSSDGKSLVYADISTGQIKSHRFGDDSTRDSTTGSTIVLATLLQPVHIEPCDLDADGLTDLLVADIGEFNANDSDLGRVVWVRRKDSKTDKFETHVLAEGLSRTADARQGDFDGDGDLDVLVGVFGWRNSGEILMLENTGSGPNGLPTFGRRVIDKRHGPVHLPVVDLNGDGHLDFVALISQDHECVEAFINSGNGDFQFERQVIYQAPDPAYGSSGIELVDMDGDGDLDVLYSNGDSFDRGPKPHHGIQWLEQDSDRPGGPYPFAHHRIGTMPGVLNARAGDFDGDGDMDVVAAALLSDPIVRELMPLDTSSVVLWTQTEPGQFVPSKVEGKSHFHISIETGDFDADGRDDFAVGNFMRSGDPTQPDVIVWSASPQASPESR